jgi:hypothetical protein
MFGCEGVAFGGRGGSAPVHVSTSLLPGPLAGLTLGLEIAAELLVWQKMMPLVGYSRRNESYSNTPNICGIVEDLLRSKCRKCVAGAMGPRVLVLSR